MSSRAPALLAVDSGNTKLDAVLLTARGPVLGRRAAAVRVERGRP